VNVARAARIAARLLRTDCYFSTSTDPVPSERFATAREMVDSLNKADSPVTRITGLDLSAFAPFKTDVFPMVAYKLVENIRQGFSHAYRSEAGRCTGDRQDVVSD
jgi:hypothetical protein